MSNKKGRGKRKKVIYESKGARVDNNRRQTRVAEGRKFVKKAGCWLRYRCFGQKEVSNELEWEL